MALHKGWQWLYRYVMALYRSEPRSPDTRITRFKMQQITDSLIMTPVLTMRADFTILYSKICSRNFWDKDSQWAEQQ